MDYLAEIQKVTTPEALATLRELFESDLQAGRINYQAYQVIFNAYSAKSTQLAGGGNVVGSKGNLVTPEGRMGSLQEQEAGRQFGNVWSRWLQGQPGYAKASPFAQEALAGISEREYLPTRYQMAATLRPEASGAQTFEDWLGGGRPTGEQMKGQLRSIRDIMNIPLTEQTAAQGKVSGVYGDPETGQAQQFLASIQPWLAGMAPALRGSSAQAAQRSYKQYVAASPEQQWINRAKELGFF